MRYVTLVLLLALALPGCSYTTAKLSLATSKNVPAQVEVIQQGVKGRRCAFVTPILDNALLDRALQHYPEANAIANLESEMTIYPLILVEILCLEVRGDAVRITDGAD